MYHALYGKNVFFLSTFSHRSFVAILYYFAIKQYANNLLFFSEVKVCY